MRVNRWRWTGPFHVPPNGAVSWKGHSGLSMVVHPLDAKMPSSFSAWSTDTLEVAATSLQAIGIRQRPSSIVTSHVALTRGGLAGTAIWALTTCPGSGCSRILPLGSYPNQENLASHSRVLRTLATMYAGGRPSHHANRVAQQKR
jgi:hypothetical protein